MLNRIRVRGKLLLLLTTPLLALVIFAYLGIVERLDLASSQTREENLALLADSGSDLSRAVAQERLVGMMVEAGAQTDLEGWATLTSDSVIRWLDRASVAREVIRDPETVAAIDQLTGRLNERIARGVDTSRSTTTRLAELSLLSRSIAEISDGLVAEADDLGLYRALFVQGYSGEMQESATVIAVVGADSIRTGRISTVASGVLEAADRLMVDSTVGFREQADPEYVAMLADLRTQSLLPRVADDVSTTLRDLTPLVSDGQSAGQVEWLDLGLRRIDGIHGISERILRDASLSAASRARLAQDSAKNFMVLAGSVALAALLMAVLIGRSISRPLVRLSRSAQQLSSEELPALVESMRTGGRIAPPEMTPIEAKGRDEVAQLGYAISEIQKVTVEVAEEQTALLHRGISEMFINLARRNQSLLDRQIQFIDSLEASEEDPDQLENLFQLDHLATRMRRNAESLLVLAGGEPSRRRGEPIGIESVIRVAISEIEDYSRVDLRSIDDSLVPTSAAVDLAHLTSELMENATQFSPPESRVDVVGHRTLEGTYQITIADHGIGMAAERLAEANRTLAEPPIVGLDMGRSLGFTVVARIAERLGLTVRLTPTPQGGLTAVVSLPSGLLVRTESKEEPTESEPVSENRSVKTTRPATPRAAAPERAKSAPTPGRSVDLFDIFGTPQTATAPTDEAAGDLFTPVAAKPATPTAPPAPEPPDGPTIDQRGRSGVISTLPPPPPLPTRAAPRVLPQRRTAASAEPEDSTQATRTQNLTSAGLVRRTPGGTGSDARPLDAATEHPAGRSGRSPEEIREMLARYRGGLQRGHDPSGTPDPEQNR